MVKELGQARRVGLAVQLSALIFLLALGVWAVTALQRATADQQELAQAASLTTEQLAYSPDQTVTLTLRNTAREPLTLPTESPFTISHDGEVIYQPFGDPTSSELPAGESKSWNWDGHDALGDPVPSGSYEIAAAYTYGGSESIVRTSIVLLPPSTLTGGFEAAPLSGAVPLDVSLRCPADQGPVVADFGDGSDSVLVDRCPSTINHTYTAAGSFSLSLRKGSEPIGTQTITTAAASTAGTSSQGFLSTSSLQSLLLTLVAAAIASGLISYFVIGRPVAYRRDRRSAETS